MSSHTYIYTYSYTYFTYVCIYIHTYKPRYDEIRFKDFLSLFITVDMAVDPHRVFSMVSFGARWAPRQIALDISWFMTLIHYTLW